MLSTLSSILYYFSSSIKNFTRCVLKTSPREASLCGHGATFTRVKAKWRDKMQTCDMYNICYLEIFFWGCMLRLLIVTIHVQCQLCVCRFSNTSSNSFVCLGFSNPENWYSVFMYVMDSIISVLCTIFSNFSGFGEFVFPVTHHVHAWIQ